MKYYVEGDSITVNHCGKDLSASATGKVVYADKEHLIVRFEFCNQLAAYGINRDSLEDCVVSSITEQGIDTLRKNEFDVFLDMKCPHQYLTKDTNYGIDWEKEMFWDNLILDEPINGFIVVEKDGKYNFIDLDTDEYFSNKWFDKVTNWCYHGFDRYTVVQDDDRCYVIIKDDDDVFLSPLGIKVQLDYEGIFGVKLPEPIIVKVDPKKTVCNIDNKWHLTTSIYDPFRHRMWPNYAKRYKGECIKMDRQWWYFMYTTFACGELSIGQANGKYGLFPLVEPLGMQHGDYYAEGYPFIYDDFKVFDSPTIKQETFSENAYGYIAVKENDKWGLFKMTGMPTLKLERIADSIYSDYNDIFTELGIELQEGTDGPDLREQD